MLKGYEAKKAKQAVDKYFGKNIISQREINKMQLIKKIPDESYSVYALQINNMTLIVHMEYNKRADDYTCKVSTLCW